MPHNDILNKIVKKLEKCSKGQRVIGQFIVSQYDKAAFMTAAKLASVVGVSESTVVRFASELGYDGYPELQKSLQEVIRMKLTSFQRMEIAFDRIGEDDILTSVLQADIDKIRQTLETINKEDFANTVDSIISAKKIYILGVRSSSALASFLGFYFNLMFENVRLVHTTSASEIFEQILRVKPEDTVIGISFPRYSKRTIKALEYAKDQGANVIVLTDNITSPLVESANHVLLAKSDMASFVDSLVAPLSVVNALVVAIAMKKKTEVYSIFENLENIWDEYNVYEKYTDDDTTVTETKIK